MKYKKCPMCELNFIQDSQELCPTCQPQERNSKSNQKDFFTMDLKIGDVIKFIHDPSKTAIICGERTVRFENKEWSMDKLMRELYKRMNKNCNIGSGFEVFRYDNTDKNLYARWDRIQEQKRNQNQ